MGFSSSSLEAAQILTALKDIPEKGKPKSKSGETMEDSETKAGPSSSSSSLGLRGGKKRETTVTKVSANCLSYTSV